MAPLRRGQVLQAGLQRFSQNVTKGVQSVSETLHIRVDITKVPDWKRRATRLSIAVITFGMLGHCVRFEPGNAALAAGFRQSCNWAAITCIVVTAPLIGKVAQVAFDRLLGTAVGGFVGFCCFTAGFHLFGELGGGVFISLMAGVAIWATTFLAYRHSLDQLARFMQLTYCIVAFGAKPDKGAFLLALLRVGGIFAGGVFSVLLAVLVLPRSASVEALREMKKGLKALHDLNREVWALSGVAGGDHAAGRRAFRKQHRHGYSALHSRATPPPPDQQPAKGPAQGDGVPGAPDPRPGGAAGVEGGSHGLRGGYRFGDLSSDHLELLVLRDTELDSREAVIEKLFTSVYTTLGKVDEALAQTNGEIYVWHFWGRYFFVPGVHWFPVAGRWRVPTRDVEALATCLRRVARMLWTLLLDFEEGFGADMEAVLHRYYPRQLLSELANYQARAILDLLSAFPNKTTIEVDNLLTLGQVTDCLLQISDARARQAVFDVKVRRRRSMASAASAAPAAAASPAPPASGSGRAAAVAAAGVGIGAARALEAELGRMQSTQALGVADGAAAAAPPQLESQPLLGQQQQQLSSAPSGGRGAPGGDPGSGAVRGGSFVSRLMSGQPGSHVALHLPPRRYMQERQRQHREQQEQQQQGQGQQQRLGAPEGGEAERSDSIDIFDGFRFDLPPAAVSASGSSTASGVAGGGTGAGTLPQAGAGSGSEPQPQRPMLQHAAAGGGGGGGGELLELGTLPAGRLPDPGASPPPPPAQAAVGAPGAGPTVGAAGAGASPALLPPLPPLPRKPLPTLPSIASGQRLSDLAPPDPLWQHHGQQPDPTRLLKSPPGPTPASPFHAAASFSRFSQTGDTPAASARPSLDFYASPAHASPAPATVASGSPDRAANPAPVPAAAAPAPWPSLDRLGGGLGSMASALLVEPVTFPPTEEGYMQQVRWYSFQFILDEMVNELEEAFVAASAVLRQLPYPVGS